MDYSSTRSSQWRAKKWNGEQRWLTVRGSSEKHITLSLRTNLLLSTRGTLSGLIRIASCIDILHRGMSCIWISKVRNLWMRQRIITDWKSFSPSLCSHIKFSAWLRAREERYILKLTIVSRRKVRLRFSMSSPSSLSNVESRSLRTEWPTGTWVRKFWRPGSQFGQGWGDRSSYAMPSLASEGTVYSPRV